MTPEQKSRQKNDRQFEQTFWSVQSRWEMNIFDCLSVAVREFKLTSGFADDLLHLDGEAAGVTEAQKEGFPLTEVETQTGKYVKVRPDGVAYHDLPLMGALKPAGGKLISRPTAGL